MIPLNQSELFFLLFDYYNEALFDNKLKKSFMKMKKKILGFFLLDGENPSKQPLNCDSKAVHIFVLHELIHAYLTMQGKTSRNGYHSKIFAQAAKEKGLSTFSIDEPGKDTGMKVGHNFIPGAGADKAYDNFPTGTYVYQPLPVIDKTDKKGRKKKSAYQCPACGKKMWGKTNVLVPCYECFELMTEEEAEEESISGKQKKLKNYKETAAAKKVLAILKKKKNQLHKKLLAAGEDDNEGGVKERKDE